MDAHITGLLRKASTLFFLCYATFLGGQSNDTQHRTYSPTKSDCLAKSEQATDSEWLSKRSAPEVTQLDWELSVCTLRFAPLRPKGADLILDAHGMVADEFRMRIEKAIGTLSKSTQAEVWAAFNADMGSK
ncbi:MAG TPA: hypothetical protein VII95_18835 [Terriglobales bacterium]|jgi:hypothetical protein